MDAVRERGELEPVLVVDLEPEEAVSADLESESGEPGSDDQEPAGAEPAGSEADDPEPGAGDEDGDEDGDGEILDLGSGPPEVPERDTVRLDTLRLDAEPGSPEPAEPDPGDLEHDAPDVDGTQLVDPGSFGPEPDHEAPDRLDPVGPATEPVRATWSWASLASPPAVADQVRRQLQPCLQALRAVGLHGCAYQLYRLDHVLERIATAPESLVTEGPAEG